MIRALALAALLAACGPRARTPRPPPQAADIQARLVVARGQLATAEARLAAGDHRGAYDAALRGVDALARFYAARLVKDDTDLHLDIARMAYDEGDVASAAAEAIGSLRTRIDLTSPTRHPTGASR